MCSIAAPTFLEFNPPSVNTRCGEVFCSQTFEDFLINCIYCSQEFNLLSCTLFIKHVKDCTPCSVSNPRDPEYRSDQHTGNQDVSNYTIDNLLKDALKNNNIDDPTSEINSDPLMPLKQEFEREKDEVNNFSDEDDSMEDIENLSDYQDEDDLTIDKVVRRKVIEGIIDEYKKHSVLWDVYQMENFSTRTVKNHHYKQVRKAVNSKLKTNFTDEELRAQIINLRIAYKRVLKRKEKFAKGFTDGNILFDTKLWYFDKISFIGAKSSDIKIESIQDDDSDRDGVPETNDSQDENSSDSAKLQVGRDLKKGRRERPIHKILCEPKIISDIIGQYKKYPFLWDQTASLYNDKYARKDAFRQITTFINKKFNKNVTDKELRQQIVNLRSGYRRAQRKKHRADYRISLWYFNDLSFIDNKSETAENCPILDESQRNNEVKPKCEDPSNYQTLDMDESFETIDPQSCEEDDNEDEDIKETSKDNLSCRTKSNRKIILSLIEEYQRHPCLWDNYLYKTSSRFDRYDANKEITNTINAKYKKEFTEIEIRNKIVQLRSSYRRVLRKKEAFEKQHANAKRKFHPQLWYFDKMAFIGATENDFSVSRRKKRKIKPSDRSNEREDDENATYNEDDEDTTMDEDYRKDDESENSEEEPSEGEEKPKSKSFKRITKNKELLTTLIEEYKKQPMLWAVKHYTNDNSARRKAYVQLARVINAKFNTQFTPKSISQEIIKLRSTYKRMLRRKQESPDGEFKTKMWYADLLSFIERKPRGLIQENEIPVVFIDDNQHDDSVYDNGSEEDDETGQKRRRLNNREHVFEIIELLKAAPILWDSTHHQYNLRTERRKTIEQIISNLSAEHNCQLTVEEFRHQIRFLKDSYFRAVRQEAAAKEGDIRFVARPFFFDRMSFLEPFVDKKTSFKSDALNENFAFLTENKQLMIDFIALYKDQACLWDPKHKDRYNQPAHKEAYSKIVNMFSENDVILTKKEVTSAINFLHNTAVHSQKSSSEPPIWFYEHLQFLSRVPRIKDKYCNHCDQYFRKVADYEKHKIEIAGDYPYKCSVCNAGFVSRSKYAYHQITHKEPHKCEQCGFQAFDKHNFNVHMRRHKGIHPFKCEHCDKGFVTSTELNRHLRMHTGEKPFICDICGKSLAANSEFHQHMKRHRNQRDHKCDVCGSAFFTPKTLRDHMASHSSERQHVCEVCGAAFKRKKTLHQHKALHAEQKKHECKICGKLFAQKAGVYSHMKSHGLMLGS